jgi:hypothetical protein
MSEQDKVTMKDLPPLVPDDAPAAAKKMQPEQATGEDDTLAHRVAQDPLLPDERQHTSAASPPKHM